MLCYESCQSEDYYIGFFVCFCIMTKLSPEGSRFYFMLKENWGIEVFHSFFYVKIILSGCLNVTKG